MRVEYRQQFLRDLKKLRKQPVYKQLYDLAFEILPNAKSLQDVPNVKAIVEWVLLSDIVFGWAIIE